MEDVRQALAAAEALHGASLEASQACRQGWASPGSAPDVERTSPMYLSLLDVLAVAQRDADMAATLAHDCEAVATALVRDSQSIKGSQERLEAAQGMLLSRLQEGSLADKVEAAIQQLGCSDATQHQCVIKLGQVFQEAESGLLKVVEAARAAVQPVADLVQHCGTAGVPGQPHGITAGVAGQAQQGSAVALELLGLAEECLDEGEELSSQVVEVATRAQVLRTKYASVAADLDAMLDATSLLKARLPALQQQQQQPDGASLAVAALEAAQLVQVAGKALPAGQGAVAVLSGLQDEPCVALLLNWADAQLQDLLAYQEEAQAIHAHHASRQEAAFTS